MNALKLLAPSVMVRAVLVTMIVLAGIVQAQDWPTEPVRIIMP